MRLDYQILLKSPPPNLTGWIRPCVHVKAFFHAAPNITHVLDEFSFLYCMHHNRFWLTKIGVLICFLLERLRRKLLPKERYSDSLTGCGSKNQPFSWKAGQSTIELSPPQCGLILCFNHINGYKRKTFAKTRKFSQKYSQLALCDARTIMVSLADETYGQQSRDFCDCKTCLAKLYVSQEI